MWILSRNQLDNDCAVEMFVGNTLMDVYMKAVSSTMMPWYIESLANETIDQTFDVKKIYDAYVNVWVDEEQWTLSEHEL